MGDAVHAARAGQDPRGAHASLEHMLLGLLERAVDVSCCGTCCTARGLSEAHARPGRSYGHHPRPRRCDGSQRQGRLLLTGRCGEGRRGRLPSRAAPGGLRRAGGRLSPRRARAPAAVRGRRLDGASRPAAGRRRTPRPGAAPRGPARGLRRPRRRVGSRPRDRRARLRRGRGAAPCRAPAAGGSSGAGFQARARAFRYEPRRRARRRPRLRRRRHRPQPRRSGRDHPVSPGQVRVAARPRRHAPARGAAGAAAPLPRRGRDPRVLPRAAASSTARTSPTPSPSTRATPSVSKCSRCWRA